MMSAMARPAQARAAARSAQAQAASARIRPSSVALSGAGGNDARTAFLGHLDELAVGQLGRGRGGAVVVGDVAAEEYAEVVGVGRDGHALADRREVVLAEVLDRRA